MGHWLMKLDSLFIKDHLYCFRLHTVYYCAFPAAAVCTAYRGNLRKCWLLNNSYFTMPVCSFWHLSCKLLTKVRVRCGVMTRLIICLNALKLLWNFSPFIKALRPQDAGAPRPGISTRPAGVRTSTCCSP